MTISAPCCCLLCRKETSNLGIAAHHSIVHLNDARYKSALKKGSDARRGVPSWNSGGALTTDHRAKIAEALRGAAVSEITRDKISKTSKKNGLAGGFREGGGRGRKGRFLGIHCDSTWELAFLITMQKAGKNVKRINAPRLYTFNGKVSKYYPDFEVDGTVFEIKGWASDRSLAKAQQHPDVKVLGRAEIRPMLEAAQLIYGKDITVAYDK